MTKTMHEVPCYICRAHATSGIQLDVKIFQGGYSEALGWEHWGKGLIPLCGMCLADLRSERLALDVVRIVRITSEEQHVP